MKISTNTPSIGSVGGLILDFENLGNVSIKIDYVGLYGKIRSRVHCKSHRTPRTLVLWVFNNQRILEHLTRVQNLLLMG